MIPRRRLLADIRWLIAVPFLLAVGCGRPATTTSVTPPTASVGTPDRALEPRAAPEAAAGAVTREGSPALTNQAPQTPDSPPRRVLPSEFGAASALDDVHFDFDKHEIRPGDARILDENARWMKSNADTIILVEGYADERGTEEYNLALGDRRAKSAMAYLVARGVAAGRITLISYGKERPVCPEHHETCWAKNRRAHFMVKLR